MENSLPSTDAVVRLRTFEGSPKVFWSQFAEACASYAEASAAAVFSRRADGLGKWRSVAAAGSLPPGATAEAIAGVAEHALEEGLAQRSVGVAEWIVIPLETGEASHRAVLLAQLAPGPVSPSTVERLRLVADTPAQYQRFRRYRQAEAEIEHFANVIELGAHLRRHRKFDAAALALCDELSVRFQAEPVALGWRRGDYVRLVALARKPGFDRKMELVGQFEAAMEECLARDDEVLWPSPEDASQPRAHRSLATTLQVSRLVSVPLREGKTVVGVVLLARASDTGEEVAPFSEAELHALRLIGDQLAPGLVRQHASDRWFGARLAAWGEDRLKEHWNLEHPWTKLGTVLAAIGLGVLFFGKMDYRVEAPFILRPSRQALIPAPFDGYVRELAFEVGDAVPAGATILELDRTDLELRVISLQADVARFTSEAERARGEGRYAELRVAEAQREQAEALVRQAERQLAQASMVAPFDGILLDDSSIEERLGAPVSKGDILLRLARLDGLYVDLSALERDVDEIEIGATGEIAFASRPDETFAMRVERIDPVAQTEERGAVFPVRCTLEGPVESWWRPGMTGVAKIEAGRRTFFWVLTHRLVDWLHLKLWI